MGFGAGGWHTAMVVGLVSLWRDLLALGGGGGALFGDKLGGQGGLQLTWGPLARQQW